VADPPESAPQTEAPPNCDKCGQPTTFVTAIQRLGSTPGYRIFQCEPCRVLKWIAEQIAPDNSS
jgi:hypothetical protein